MYPDSPAGHRQPPVISVFAKFSELIKQSHLRSRQYGVPKSLAQASENTRLSDSELKGRLKKNSKLLKLVMAQLNLMRHILEDSSSCVAIADTEGYILCVEGTGAVMEQYKKRRCLPGYRWQERDMGTCAIGLALVTKEPVILRGHEMYSLTAQHITNSAVPVFDDARELQCIICLSGFTDKVHVHTLGMLIQAAECVTLQIKEGKRAHEFETQSQYLNALIESFQRGIVTVDKNGNIVRFNTKGTNIFGISPKNLGENIDNLIKPTFSISQYVTRGEGFLDREIAFINKGAESIHIVSLDPIVQKNIVIGGLVSVTEQNMALQFANTLAGGQAVFTFDTIVGTSAAITKAKNTAKTLAKSNASVLIQGETGTGKELFAQAIHNASERCSAPFVAINCGAIPKRLFESELFGYEEGAFTGARKGGRPGKLEMAHGGTLFLDEIGDMPFDMQVKLLRALQSGEIQRLGSARSTKLDLRVVAATNADLKSAIRQRGFRQDLYYRISTIVLTIPPLRERGNDILLLASAFFKRYNKSLGTPPSALSQEAKEIMLRYPWPGNIRQLENCIERAAILAKDQFVEADDLGLELAQHSIFSSSRYSHLSLESVEKDHIEHVLSTSSSISQAAKVLQISRPTLYRKMERYELAIK